MKKFLLGFTLVACSIGFGQTTTVNKLKITTAVEDNTSNQILVRNPTTKLINWTSKSALSGGGGNPIGYFGSGSAVFGDLSVKIGDYNNEYNNYFYEFNLHPFNYQAAHNFSGGLTVNNGLFRLQDAGLSAYATLSTSQLSTDRTYNLPNTDGTLITDAPSNGSSYVRNNGTWVVAPVGGTPTLDDVLGVGNTSTNKVINMNLGSNTIAINVLGNTTNTFRTQIYPGGILAKNSSNQIVASMAVSGSGTTGVFQLINTTGAGSVQLRGDNLSVEVSNGGFGGTLVQSALFKDRLTFKQVGGLDCYIKPETVPYNATPEWTLPGAFGKLAVIKTTAPASATDVGVVGEIRVTPTFIYTCVAPNTWVRAAVATW